MSNNNVIELKNQLKHCKKVIGTQKKIIMLLKRKIRTDILLQSAEKTLIDRTRDNYPNTRNYKYVPSFKEEESDEDIYEEPEEENNDNATKLNLAI